MKPVMSLVLVAAAVASAGCATVGGARFGNPSTFGDTNAVRVEEAARHVLMDLRFNIEYPAASEGRLDTDTITGASWFEFWRMDTIGSIQVAESSLHTIRRRAMVSVSPSGGGSQVFVKVVKERKVAPGAGPDSVGATYNLYDTAETDLLRQNELAPTEYEWVSTGRDEPLEQYILERIHARLK